MRSGIARPGEPGNSNLEIVVYYHVLLKDHTTGYINSDSLNGQHPDAFIGERVNIHLLSENGEHIQRRGILIDVLDEVSYLEYQF